uniref:Uncharacterized protein n=1 Tax=Arundo donax TaxID=35708 RepID=A0A0A9FK56_ARUDO
MIPIMLFYSLVTKSCIHFNLCINKILFLCMLFCRV